MRQYTEISDAYQGCEMSFFLLEGEKDKALNRYVRGHLKSIEKHLRLRGVRYSAFNIVSPSLFGMRSAKNLILRQCPTLGKAELEDRIKEFKKVVKREQGSALVYVSSVKYGKSGCIADILCEENFGKEGDYITTLYKFLDIVVRLDVARSSCGSAVEDKCKVAGSGQEGSLWSNSEYLACDLLAKRMTAEVPVAVSPVHFDSKFNISLPLYPQVTIKLDPLPKSLYILFLRHPEGILLNDLHSCEEELRAIYRAVSGRRNPAALNKMFKALANNTDNPLHKNMSKISRAFLSRLRSDLAGNYIPALNRAQAYAIPLDFSLVELPVIV